MYHPITAKEAREMIESNSKNNSKAIDEFFKEVHVAISENKCEMRLNPLNQGFGIQQQFTDSERNYLKSLGYTISWDGDCLWYNVSW